MIAVPDIVRRHKYWCFIAGIVVLCGITSTVLAGVGERAFLRPSLDVGVVVSDMEEAVAFYTKAIGFREADRFSMPGKLARDIGLTGGTPLNVRVLSLAEEKSAARLKLIEVPVTAAPEGIEKEGENGVVDSRTGYRYITLFVSDMDRALERLTEYGAELPNGRLVELGPDSPNEIFIALVRDPDGNLVELVGPRPGND